MKIVYYNKENTPEITIMTKIPPETIKMTKIPQNFKTTKNTLKPFE